MNLNFLHNEKPTKLWKERLTEYEEELEDELDFELDLDLGFEEGGTITDEVLEVCDKELNLFIAKLESIEQSSHDRDKQIMGYVEEIINKFNDINHDFDYFIETVEREDLAEFISRAAKAAGLEIEDGTDITLEWRDW